VRHSNGRHRRARTLSLAAAVAVAAGAGGVCLGLSDGGAEAASRTVTVSHALPDHRLHHCGHHDEL